MSKGLVLVLFLIVKEKRDTHGGREGGREGQREGRRDGGRKIPIEYIEAHCEPKSLGCIPFHGKC